MKKLLAIMLVLALVAGIFTLASCDTTEDPKETETGTEAGNNNNQNGNETNAATGDDDQDTAGGNDNDTDGESNTEDSDNGNDESTSETEATTSGDDTAGDDTAGDDTTDATESETEAQPTEADTYLGKTPLQLYTDALSKLTLANTYTVLSDALMTSTKDNYNSTRVISAKLSENALFAEMSMTSPSGETATEKTWIVGGKFYQITSSGEKTARSMSSEELTGTIARFPQNYMLIMFNYTAEHFGDAKFTVDSDSAKVSFNLTKADMAALTGESSYNEAKESVCKVEITFNKDGYIAEYVFDWTITRMINDVEATERMAYKNIFSEIGSTTVEAPEDADTFTEVGGSTSSSQQGNASDKDGNDVGAPDANE